MTRVGTYYLGHENVRVFLRPDIGGEVYACPGDDGCAQIIIGKDYQTWDGVVGVLLHEAIEFKLLRQGNRFSPNVSTANTQANYLFVMTHEQMEEMASSVGIFLADCLPDLLKAWKSIKKKKP